MTSPHADIMITDLIMKHEQDTFLNITEVLAALYLAVSFLCPTQNSTVDRIIW